MVREMLENAEEIYVWIKIKNPYIDVLEWNTLIVKGQNEERRKERVGDA